MSTNNNASHMKDFTIRREKIIELLEDTELFRIPIPVQNEAIWKLI
jgi:hypothetical protein